VRSVDDFDKFRTTTLEQAFSHLATRLEAAVGESGWDLPASLWAVRSIDVPDDATSGMAAAALGGARGGQHGGDAVGDGVDLMVAFQTTMEQILFEDPFDALAGIRFGEPDVVGVMLVTEAWMTQPGVPERQEVRICQILMRDGSHAVTIRHRATDTVDVHTNGADGSVLDGRLVWGLRRTLGMPSAVSDTVVVPTPRAVNRRNLLGVTVAMFADGVAQDLEQTQQLTQAGIELLDQQPTSDWASERQALIGKLKDRAAAAGQPAQGLPPEDGTRDQYQFVLTHLEWIDDEMFGAEMDAATVSGETLAGQLWMLVDRSVLNVSQAAALADVAGISEPVWGWVGRPDERLPCPCGSGVPFGSCAHPAHIISGEQTP
jgi:hypothetical protein